MNFANNQTRVRIELCKPGHSINGIKPLETDLQYAEQTCDCGKILYQLEECGCPTNKHMLLKEKENPNYKHTF